VSVEVSYNRRWWNHYLDVTDNTLTTAADYDAYTVTAPVDARLPNGGGYAVGTLYDIRPGLAGQAQNLIRTIENYGNYDRHWDGVDVSVAARLGAGLALQGGTSTGRLVENTCDIRKNLPEFSGNSVSATAPFCDYKEPLLTQFKGFASYTIPKADVQVSATMSSRPGVELVANVIVPTATVAQSLGRPLSSSLASVTVNMIPRGTAYSDRINQLDLRFGKTIRFNRTRTNVSLDLVNALNSDAVLVLTPLLNATWPTPDTVLKARLARLSVQFDW
jgi:hypothetical protein